MHRSEADEAGTCAACSADVATAERIFTFGDDDLLCFRCAAARGGSYDEMRDRWIIAPRVDDLLVRDAG